MNHAADLVQNMRVSQFMEQSTAILFFVTVILHIWIPVETKRQLSRLIRNNIFGFVMVGAACWMHYLRSSLEILIAHAH